MADDETAMRVRMIDGAGGAMLEALLAEAGAVVARDAAVTIIESDTKIPLQHDRAAVLALVADDAAADRAVQAGATHLLAWPSDAQTLRRTLKLAARFAAAARGMKERRVPITTSVGDWGEGDGAHSIAIVALTRFEVINAAFGREAGDAVLAAAAGRIETALEPVPSARIVRRRGAEFVIAAAVDETAMQTLADHISTALMQPFEVDATSVNLGSRIGLTQRSAGEDASAMLRRAGEALSAARESEAGTATPAAPRGTSLEALAADLHRALDRGEIAVLFQPQATLASNRIVGVEALARWEHPRLGDLGAETLFAAAQRADLGLALSEHIHAVALAAVARWPGRLAGWRVALNVTAADLARGDFAQRFLTRIEASGIARARITAEITESGLIGDLAAAAGLLAHLRGAGCRIAIDDFGTGYSSLAYLQSLPLDYLKIDRRLAQDIAGSERDRVVVRGVIAIARALGIETVAEGVETVAQRTLLADEGCTYYQGFLCAPPLDEAALIERLGG